MLRQVVDPFWLNHRSWADLFKWFCNRYSTFYMFKVTCTILRYNAPVKIAYKLDTSLSGLYAILAIAL